MKTTLELDLEYYRRIADAAHEMGLQMIAHDIRVLVAEVECLRCQVVQLEKQQDKSEPPKQEAK